MPSKKYADFEESEPTYRRGKHPPHGMRTFVDIKCPHCGEICAEVPEEHVKTSKATNCLQHLRVCDKYDGPVKEAPEKKRKYTNEDIMNEVAKVRTELKTEMAEMEKRICRTVSEKVNLGPPPAETQDGLYEKLDEARPPNVMANMHNINQSTTCVVCLEKTGDTLLTPCLHRNMCWADWQSVQAAATANNIAVKCPECRVVVTSAVRLA